MALACFLLGNILDIWQLPAPFKVGFGWGIEAQVGKPPFARDSRNPVLLFAGRRLGPEVNIYGAVVILNQIHTRRAVGDLLLVVDRTPSVYIINGNRPEFFHGRVGGHMQTIGFPPVKP